MILPLRSILLGLAAKCLLNWILVFLQINHICKSFLGVFSVSLAAVDTLLTLSISVLHVHAADAGSVLLLGVKLTRYHVCLLVQILGQVYSALQWPVVVVAAVDHFFTVTQRLRPSRARWMACLCVSSLLWYLAALYVFLLSDFVPVMEDVSHYKIHQCWVPRTSQILHVAMFLLLALGCAALHAGCSTRLLQNLPLRDQMTGAHCRTRVVHQTLRIFLSTWAVFLVFVAVLLLLPVGIPAHLGLNAAWLCFLNSLLISLVLCAVCPAGPAPAPPDSFCEWRFKFSLQAAEDTT